MTYEPIEGFFDLRKFNLSNKEMQSCYRIQKTLKHTQDNSEYYKKHNKMMWEKAKQYSAELQQFLLPRLKEGEEL